MYDPRNRTLPCLLAATLVASTLLTITVTPQAAAASTPVVEAQTARFPLA